VQARTKSRYDVFLSYNSADHGVVENVTRKLRDEGLEPFLDRWNLAPGMRWRSKLEKTLGSCKAVAIFVGRGEVGSWQRREVGVALDLQSRNPSLPVTPVLLPGCQAPLGYLSQLNWVDLRTQANGPGIKSLAKATRGQAHGADLQKDLDDVRVSICPYVGLLTFVRKTLPFSLAEKPPSTSWWTQCNANRLWLWLERQAAQITVVRAGPARLRSNHRTTWETVILVPTAEPLKALAKALLRSLEPARVRWIATAFFVQNPKLKVEKL
jgi:hypothetical protein